MKKKTKHSKPTETRRGITPVMHPYYPIYIGFNHTDEESPLHEAGESTQQEADEESRHES